MKKCRYCHGRRNLHIQSRYKRLDGTEMVYYSCRRCTNDRLKAYRKRTGYATQTAANKRWEAKRPGWRTVWARAARKKKTAA